MRGKKGFTLVELLIAITIIAVLSAIGLTMYRNAQMVARDAKRKQDVKTYQTALELFYARHGYYPSYNTNTLGDSAEMAGCLPGTHWSQLFQWDFNAGGNPFLNNAEQTTDYISSIPVDPLNTCPAGGNEHYNYWPQPLNGPGAGSGYLFCLTLENTQDPDYHTPYTSGLAIGHNYCVQNPS